MIGFIDFLTPPEEVSDSNSSVEFFDLRTRLLIRDYLNDIINPRYIEEVMNGIEVSHISDDTISFVAPNPEHGWRKEEHSFYPNRLEKLLQEVAHTIYCVTGGVQSVEEMNLLIKKREDKIREYSISRTSSLLSVISEWSKLSVDRSYIVTLSQMAIYGGVSNVPVKYKPKK